MAKKRADFTEILVRRGVVSPDQIQEAGQMAKETGTKLPDALVRLGYATGEEVMRAMAEQHGLNYVNLGEVTIPPSVVELVPESVARENAVLPLVGVGRPLDGRSSATRWISTRSTSCGSFSTGRSIYRLAPREAILEAINRHYGQTVGESADSMLKSSPIRRSTSPRRWTKAARATKSVDEASAPIVRLVQLIITEAVQLRASDIHIEPFEDRIRVRYRIDGVLIERDSPPRRLLGAILSRIKILAKLDIAERRRTQDGRIKVTVGEKELDLRVSIIPSSHGQSVVMRILDKDNITVGLRQLGFAEDDYLKFKNLISRPNGISW